MTCVDSGLHVWTVGEIRIYEKRRKIEGKYGGKKDLSMVRKALHRQENDDLLLQPAMLETGLQTPHDGAKDGAASHAGDEGTAFVAGKAGILHLFAGGTADGCKPPVHLQTGQGGETPRIAAQREDVVDTAGRHRAHAQKQTL